MKALRFVCFLVVLTVFATTIVGQTAMSSPPGAQPASSAQSTPVAQPSSEKKSLSDQDRKDVDARLDELVNKYGSKGNWYLAAYYIFVLGAAVAAALAGLILQWDTPEKSYKKAAQLLAFVGSALAIVTTSVNFKVQSAANKTAVYEFRYLKNAVSAGSSSDKAAIEKEIIDIEKRKGELALR